MFQRIFVVALIAGLLAGLTVTAVQMSWSVPLIMAAETYETEAPATSHAHEAPAAHAHEVAHDHDGAGWAPRDGFERAFWTWMTNVLLGIGGGLLIAGAFALRRSEAGWRTGLAWGAGAFLAFGLSPSIGLPPELPGTAAADLAARQTWWLFTVIATGAGLGLGAYARRGLIRLAGVALVLAPHIVGAPQPAHDEALAPLALREEFIVAALVSSACFWLVLGGTAGYLAGRFRLAGIPSPMPA